VTRFNVQVTNGVLGTQGRREGLCNAECESVSHVLLLIPTVEAISWLKCGSFFREEFQH
jgi:hypothetical protein